MQLPFLWDTFFKRVKFVFIKNEYLFLRGEHFYSFSPLISLCETTTVWLVFFHTTRTVYKTYHIKCDSLNLRIIYHRQLRLDSYLWSIDLRINVTVTKSMKKKPTTIFAYLTLYRHA